MHNSLERLSDEQLCMECARSSLAMEELVRRYRKLVRAPAPGRIFWPAPILTISCRKECWDWCVRCLSMIPPGRASFKTFAAVCIRSRLISAVRAAGSPKKPSADLIRFRFVPSLWNAPPDDPNLQPTEKSPEELLIGREEFAEFQSRLSGALSPLESQTLELYLEGLSYRGNRTVPQ